MKKPTKKTRSPAPDLSIFGKLAEYNRKRRFEVTPEPAGKLKRSRKKDSGIRRPKAPREPLALRFPPGA